MVKLYPEKQVRERLYRGGIRRLPGFDVAALLHEGAEGEPETVEDGEVVGDRRTVGVVFDVPLERTEATDEKQDDADADIREYHTHPDLMTTHRHIQIS